MKSKVAIIKKEFIELSRDKLTLFFLIVSIVAFPILNIFTSFLNFEQTTDLKVAICAENQNDYSTVAECLAKLDGFDINTVKTEDPSGLLKNGDVSFAISINSKEINFMYNSSSVFSLMHTAKVGDAFQGEYYKIIGEKNKDFRSVNLTDDKESLFSSVQPIFSLLIPTMLILAATQSSSTLANNTFAGEKERKTFEMLLLSGAKRSDIYVGKCLALLVVSIFNMIMSLLSYYFTYQLDNLSAVNIFTILTSLIMITVLSVFLSATVSLISSDVKNSQVINEFILFIPVIITGCISLGILNINNENLSLIPLINLLICFSNAFKGEVNLVILFVSLAESIFVIMILFLFSKKYIESEKAIK